MSAIGDQLAPALAHRTQSAARADSTVRDRLLVYAACTAAALVCNFMLGVDVGWDTLDYHLYAGLSAVHDRFSQDYFAAGPQAYFNPYVYAPFYLLVASGLPALVVSSILAVAHSTVLWLTYELALCVCPSGEPRVRLVTGACAVALALLNPVLVQQIGSSFADITTASVVLLGWLLLALAVREPRARLIVAGGLLLGGATALKLTNAAHALAAVTLLLMLPRRLWDKVRYGLGYAGALATGFAIVAGPWAWLLLRRFGNPFFPLLNSVFRSPEFTTEPLRHYRFVPASLAEALWRPFAIANPVPTVQVELLAPDIRYALLLLLACGAAVVWLARRHASAPAPNRPAESAVATRVLWALACGFAVDWIIWLSASGNGRYFLPMACVAAVLIVALLHRELAAWPKARTYALAAILGAQLLQVVMGTDSRSVGVPWQGGWFRVEVPEKLASEPNLYLTIGIQSNSFIAAYLPRGSGLVNFAGAYALGSEGASGARVEMLIRRYWPRVRMLTDGTGAAPQAQQSVPLPAHVDDALERFGLRADPLDCATIAARGLPPPPRIQFGHGAPSTRQPEDTTYLLTCRVVPEDPARRLAGLANAQSANLVLDRLEDACPELFQPRRLLTVHFGGRWLRQYVNTDLLAWVSRGEVWFRDLDHADGAIAVGSENAWIKAPLQLSCGRRDGHYFARVVGSAEAH